MSRPFIAGLTTNPTLMRKAGVADYRAFAKDVLRAVRDKPISFEVFCDDFAGMETGDGGVYSTVRDLLRFDQALYTDALVNQRTLAEAFTPFPVRDGTSTYGFGWNIVTDSTGRRVWHQGNTGGFRAFIERRLADRITVIMLTNGGDTNRMAINGSIQRILSAEPTDVKRT